MLLREIKGTQLRRAFRTAVADNGSSNNSLSVVRKITYYEEFLEIRILHFSTLDDWIASTRKSQVK
jgi:hypothetical protein